MSVSATVDAVRLDDARLAAVRRYEILDAPADGAFDSIARAAATVCGTPIATVSIVDADRVWFAAGHGMDGVTQVGVEPGLCASAFIGDVPYVIHDAASDPRSLYHPLVRGRLGLRFYAAAPIVTADGHHLGTVAAIDHAPRQPTEMQTSMLAHLADIVAQQLELRLAALTAVRAERRLREQDSPPT
jgi:GAF domain-containing protein